MKRLLLLLLLLASPALADDNAVIVTPGTGLVMKSKDTGGGIQAMQPVISDTSGNALATPTAGADTVSNSTEGLATYNFPLVFNGTSWDRWYGDKTSGAWVNLKTAADGAIITLGAKADAKATTTDTTPVSLIQVTKEISYMEQNPASRAVTGVDGALVTIGAKADAKSSATDTTPITLLQVQKEISFAEQYPATASTSNPTSTLTLPSTTTAYTAGQLVCTSGTAGTCNTALSSTSFAIVNSAGAAAISRLRLSTNDSTSTAWGSQIIQVDLWSAAPTFTNGDRGAWALATGSAGHLGTFTCTMSAEQGDGAYAECAPVVGNAVLVKLSSGTAVYWSVDALTGSGVTGASKVFTLTAEVTN